MAATHDPSSSRRRTRWCATSAAGFKHEYRMLSGFAPTSSAPRRGRRDGARVRAVRRAVVWISDAAHGRTAGQHRALPAGAGEQELMAGARADRTRRGHGRRRVHRCPQRRGAARGRGGGAGHRRPSSCLVPPPPVVGAARGCGYRRGPARVAIEAFKPSAILHLAAQGGVNRSWREPAEDAHINVLGTVSVLAAAVAAGCRRVVVASSGGALYGAARRLPTPEDEPTQPRSPYGTAKLCIEHYLGHFTRAGSLDALAPALRQRVRARAGRHRRGRRRGDLQPPVARGQSAGDSRRWRRRRAISRTSATSSPRTCSGWARASPAR